MYIGYWTLNKYYYYLFSLGVLNYVVCCVRDVMDVVFSVCIVRRKAVGARVLEV